MRKQKLSFSKSWQTNKCVCVKSSYDLTVGNLYYVTKYKDYDKSIFAKNDYGIYCAHSSDTFMTIEEYRDAQLNKIL